MLIIRNFLGGKLTSSHSYLMGIGHRFLRQPYLPLRPPAFATSGYIFLPLLFIQVKKNFSKMIQNDFSKLQLPIYFFSATLLILSKLVFIDWSSFVESFSYSGWEPSGIRKEFAGWKERGGRWEKDQSNRARRGDRGVRSSSIGRKKNLWRMTTDRAISKRISDT